MSTKHRELGIALSCNRIFTQCINKIVGPCILKISNLCPLLDYRIVGARSFLNIIDKSTLKNMQKIQTHKKYFENSLKTLDWDIVIIPKNACGCVSVELPDPGDYMKLIEKLCKELGNNFTARSKELNWILEGYELKTNKISFNIDTKHNNSCKFSLGLQYGTTNYDISIFDLYDGTKNYDGFVPDHGLVYETKLYFQDHFGYKYIGLVDIIKNILHVLKTESDECLWNCAYTKLVILLNCASTQLLNNSYYTKLLMFLNKTEKKKEVYDKYLNELKDILNPIMEKKTNKLLNFKLTNAINTINDGMLNTTVTLTYTEGKSIFDDTLHESIRRAHDGGMACADKNNIKTKSSVKKIIEECCKEKNDKNILNKLQKFK